MDSKLCIIDIIINFAIILFVSILVINSIQDIIIPESSEEIIDVEIISKDITDYPLFITENGRKIFSGKYYSRYYFSIFDRDTNRNYLLYTTKEIYNKYNIGEKIKVRRKIIYKEDNTNILTCDYSF